MKKIDKLAEEFLAAKSNEAAAREARLLIEAKLIKELDVNPEEIGTTTGTGDLYKAKIAVVAQRKADIDAVIKQGLEAQIAKKLFKVKFEFSKSQYDAVLKEAKSDSIMSVQDTNGDLVKKLEKIYSKCVEETAMKPSVTVEPL